jgi:hypothetical protein
MKKRLMALMGDQKGGISTYTAQFMLLFAAITGGLLILALSSNVAITMVGWVMQLMGMDPFSGGF